MRKIIEKTLHATFTTNYRNTALLLLRLFVGLMMLNHGLAKVCNFGELYTTFFDPIGLGVGLSLIMIIMAEVGASICILLGLLTRPAALVLAFAMSVAAFIAQAPVTILGSELPLMYLGIYVFLLITGAGRYSVDEIIRRKLSIK